jgi:hypothetical protein
MSTSHNRDDFPAKVKKALAYRVSLQCSNPLCRRPTAAAHSEPDQFNCIGEAAHIAGASPGGPRYDPTISRAERCSANNGIWLCRPCARFIDTDEERFPASLLRQWKLDAERNLLEELNIVLKTEKQPSDFSVEMPFELFREVNVRFGFSFLAPEKWSRWDPQNGEGAKFSHPDDDQVEIRAWAHYAILHDNLEDSAEWSMNILRKEGYFELISISDATRSVCDVTGEPDKWQLTQQAVKAIRMVYRSGAYTYLHVKTRVGGTEFDVRCQVLSERYLEFRTMFILVTNSLRVLGSTMAEHAANKPSPQELVS